MAGLPVVASNYPGMGKFVTDNKMGITCDPESAEGISAAKHSNCVIRIARAICWRRKDRTNQI